MVHTNKVLTVSYGTFSCTLEGFDDSFGTMKAIAEYFRDLASDDRYFGAEPPQPDAEMLARIAQREISRRVEAHADGNAIVLRAEDSVTGPVAEDEDEVIEAPASVAAASAAPEPVQPVLADQEAADPTTESDASDHAEPVPASDQAIIAAPSTETDEADSVTDDATPPAAPEATAELTGSLISEDVEETSPLAASSAALAPAVDSIAAKLQRIRDVVARDATLPEDEDTGADHPAEMAETADQAQDETQTEAPVAELDSASSVEVEPVPESAEDEPAEETPSEPEHEEQAVAEPAEDAERVEAPSTETVAESTESETQQSDAALLDAIAAADLTQDDAPAAQATSEQTPDALQSALDDIAQAAEDDDEFEDAATIETAPFDLTAFEAVTGPIPEDEPSNVGAAGEDTIFAGLDQIDSPGTGAAEDDDDDDDDKVMRNILADDTAPDAADDPTATNRARVIKVKRADLEAAIERGALEEIEDDDDEPAATSLSPEEEAELARELAEVEAELGDPADARPDADADMPRLLAEAGQKMAEGESATNRETYAQLRAAVAATRAEQQVSGDPKLLTLDDEYRKDLANVVRPDRPMTRPLTRPVSRTPDRSRPAADIAAPLKLVAEQRVDGNADEPRAPVRPRRVTTELLDDEADRQTTEEEVSAFALFAEKVGATELSELLEAAAAYMSFVEGREKFSRPQLMTKVRQVEKDDFNREDGLRSFGQLLREGKIQKAGGGRFMAAPDIGFRPDQRAAG